MPTNPLDDETTSLDTSAKSDDATELQANDPQDSQANELMLQVDALLSHVWMVRTFLKHSDEAADDEELADVHRVLYDYMLALGPSIDSGNGRRYLQLARKKLSKLKAATSQFIEIQPEVSGHMNFRMAAKSLRLVVDQIDKLLS